MFLRAASSQRAFFVKIQKYRLSSVVICIRFQYDYPYRQQNQQKGWDRMKKRISGVGTVFFALLLAMLLGCGSKGGPDSVLGRYDGMELEYDDYTMEVDASENYIELKEKGKLEIALEGETSSGKWSLDGDELTVTLKNDSNEYAGVLQDGWLILDLQDLVYTFKSGNAGGSVLSRLKNVENGVAVYNGDE